MNLKARFSLLALVLMLTSGLAVWAAVQTLAEDIITEWAQRYVDKQVRYDKQRVMQPLLREIALAQQLASSPVLLEWLQQPDDLVQEYHALMELERYRESFQNKNYFIGVRSSGHYYYNNAENEYGSDQLRYTLQPDAPEDRWFYQVIEQGRDLIINVNPDQHLGVTKLWIDVLLRNPDDGEVLAVAGTGLDLGGFLNDFVDSGEAGISSLFVDHNRAIQLYRDQSLIDFASLTKPEQHQLHLDRMLSAADLGRLTSAMAEVQAAPEQVASRFVTMEGVRYLAGIAYLPEIDWYEITLMDLNQLLPLSRFNTLLLAFGASLLITILIFQIVLGRVVLAPLQALDAAMRRVRNGQYTGGPLKVRASGEVGRLVREFEQMTAEVHESRTSLEHKVRERTEALHRISQTDELTGLFNRRGMDVRLQEELARSRREHRPLAVIWIDLDRFKEINDIYGHGVGDEALKLVAQVLRSVVREYDAAARWGGDEFLLMLRDADYAIVQQVCERLLRVIRGRTLETDSGAHLCMTFSIGACITCDGNLEQLLRLADAALYEIKAAGRNDYRIEVVTGARQSTDHPVSID
ncbi:diguanylate cyclase [Marinobacterium weihaiense]|uniref:diguanylate cyclase n=1 Tax=Marinobacterium weihaiense TaxID=2851016 RepID=A0ABS6M8H9_9GAMM|nr:diguanylate cyclase [Marinobacterium weihaiense]MBV0932588.1 diguanylate cyclase [Marinobacterium weihaiense]